MTKPVLLVDTNFLIHIYGQATEDKPRGQNYSVPFGESMLDQLSKKYDIRVTSTVLDEATFLPEFKGIRNWFDAHAGKEVTIYQTPQFTGKNGGELSIKDAIERTVGRDPTLPAAGDTANLQIATQDKLLRKSNLKDHVVPTEVVAEQALVDGTLSRASYDELDRRTGDILRARGDFRSSAEVYKKHGMTPPPAVETKQQAPNTASSEGASPGNASPGTASPDNPPPKPASPPATEPTVEVKTPPAVPVLEGAVLAEAASAGNSKFVPPTSETKPVPVEMKPGVGNAGAAGVGFVLGAKGLHDSIQNGDAVGGTIAGANMATSGVQMTEGILEATGNSLPILSKAGKFIPGANVALTIADGAYQISKEDTAQHKIERTVAVGATATTGLVLGTATASAAEAGVITTGVTSVLGTGVAATGTAAVVTAAAPVVLTVAAVGAVAYTGEKVIETNRAWEGVDKQIAEYGAAHKREGYKSDDGKPSVLAYNHILGAVMGHSDEMKNENMNGTAGLQRDARGRFKLDDFKKIDFRDPKNIAELERVVKAGIEKQDKILKDSHNVLDNVLPKWMAHGEKTLDTITNAQSEKANLAGAMQELQWYKQELADWDKAHPDDPATTQAAKPKNGKAPGGP